MRLLVRRAVGVAVGLVALGWAAPAPAQQISGTLRTELMSAPRDPEHHVVKIAGTFVAGRLALSGYSNLYGEDTNRRYSELASRTNLVGRSGPQVELNEARGIFAVVRAGYIVDIPMPRGLYLNVKVLPLTMSVKGDRGVQQGGKVGTFATVTRGDFHLENWFNWVVAEGRAPQALTEFTAWYRLAGPAAAEFQVARNVMSEGWAVRVGARLMAF